MAVLVTPDSFFCWIVGGGFGLKYCCSVLMLAKLKSSSLFGVKLLLIKIESSKRHFLMSSNEYPLKV